MEKHLIRTGTFTKWVWWDIMMWWYRLGEVYSQQLQPKFHRVAFHFQNSLIVHPQIAFSGSTAQLLSALWCRGELALHKQCCSTCLSHGSLTRYLTSFNRLVCFIANQKGVISLELAKAKVTSWRQVSLQLTPSTVALSKIKIEWFRFMKLKNDCLKNCLQQNREQDRCRGSEWQQGFRKRSFMRLCDGVVSKVWNHICGHFVERVVCGDVWQNFQELIIF